ncbi:hypothetical protein CsSME_00028821 [Camellia sinensis var. sinensis]
MPYIEGSYKNVRPDYLKNIWKVVSWKYASEVYEKVARRKSQEESYKFGYSTGELSYMKYGCQFVPKQ